MKLCYLMPLCLAVLDACHGVSLSEFYSFGEGVGDRRVPNQDEGATEEIKFRHPFVFYGETYFSYFINVNGIISFLTEIPYFFNTQFPLDYPVIAPFYSDIDTSGSGNIWYRETSDPTTIQKTIINLSSNFERASGFRPSSILIITYESVGAYQARSDRVNTFQIVLITDSVESFVLFHYADGGLQWLQGDGKTSGLPDALGQAGFVAKDGRLFTLRGSGKDQVRNLDRWSNVDRPGVWMFRVGQIDSGKNIQPPSTGAAVDAQLNSHTDGSESSCAFVGAICHSSGRCVDYDEGFCCQCNEQTFGNGINCIKRDSPMRVTGKVSGNINGVDIIDGDLHSYVLVTKGRMYIAVSRIPKDVGYDLQSLTGIGEGIAWLFATPKEGVPNGFTLTGGIFNRSVEINFPQSGHKVEIQQTFEGLDVFNNVAVTTTVIGSVPTISIGSELEVDALKEQITRVDYGKMRSRSNRSFRLKGQTLETPYSVETFIDFDECDKAPRDSNIDTLRFEVSENIFIQLDEAESIVRFLFNAKIETLEEVDPCIRRGRKECGAHSQCIVDGDNYRCVCEQGFDYNYDSSIESTLCLDMNECDLGRDLCDKDALCINNEGSYSCQCNRGFAGDGHYCRPEFTCYNAGCNHNALCEEINGQPECKCKSGYTGDGFFCSPDFGDANETQDIMILLTDVNDELPFLANKIPMTALLAQGAPFGTVVFRVQATDLDRNSDLRFVMVEGFEEFQLNEASGVISTNASTNDTFVEGGSFTLVVRVEDRNQTIADGTFQSSENAMIQVTVGAPAPQFQQSAYQITIPETTEIGQSIVKITASPFVEEVMIYSLRSDNLDNLNSRHADSDLHFEIDKLTGEITLTSKQTFENSLRSHMLRVTATGNSSGLSSEVTVTIEIEDVNDEIPFFTNALPMQGVVDLDASVGSVVLQVLVSDNDQNNDLHIIVTRNESRGLLEFEGGTVNEIKVKEAGQFIEDEEYVLFVRVEDRNGSFSNGSVQSSEEHRISIIGGRRPPQVIHPSPLNATIREDARVGDTVIELGVDMFCECGRRYSLRAAKEEDAGIFAIHNESGIITLEREVDFESQNEGKLIYNVSVTVHNLVTGQNSSVEIPIEVVDVNDNAPVFGSDEYTKSSVSEEFPIGARLIRVDAIDRDSGRNGEVVYSVTHNQFTVNSEGEISILSPLDAFPDDHYDVIVTATDRGEPPMQSQAMIHINVVNMNNRKPEFTQQVYTPNVAEDSPIGTRIAIIEATDGDGDNIDFSLDGALFSWGGFEIGRRSGEIRLLKNSSDLLKDATFEFNVTAMDDGSCCEIQGSNQPHISTAVVVVSVSDVNDNKPEFVNCSSYQPSLNQSAPVGTSVLAVDYFDNDKGRNQLVEFSLMEEITEGNEINPFTIDKETGIITLVQPITNREARRIPVTVKATDFGEPQLEGFCSFFVNILGEEGEVLPEDEMVQQI